MDMGTVKRKLQSGKYLSPEDFERDSLLVFSNCKKYNPLHGPGQIYHKRAIKCEKRFKHDYENLIGVLETETVQKFRKVLRAVFSDEKGRVPFMDPVPHSVPGYYAKIKKPMDLRTVRQKL